MKTENRLMGKRIAVRSYKKSDLDFVSSMWFDRENGKYLSDPEKEFIDERFQKAVDGLEDSESGFYFVAERLDTGEPIGTGCAFPDSGNSTIYDIGYCVHKDYWRQGYGSEIVSVLLDFIRYVGGEKVTAEAAKENEASCALLKKLGFEVIKEARFKKYNMDITYESFIFGRSYLKEKETALI